MIDIAIPLARDKNTNYYDLRMTLRSIDKYLTGHGNVYIIGEKPSWLRNVIHIPLQDIAGRKAWSIFRKMITAAGQKDISQKFISWADDTYLLQPLQVCDIKDWHDNTLKHWTTLNVNSLYRQIIINTYKIFPEGLFYNVHTPCIYDKHKLLTIGNYPWTRTDFLLKSLYFNQYPGNPEQMKDPKLKKGMFYSSNGKLGSDDHKLLTTHFPNPCKYEADYNPNAKAARSVGAIAG